MVKKITKKKNGEVDGEMPGVETRFTSQNQPPPKAKSRGAKKRWDAIKFGNEYMLLVKKYGKYKLARIKEMVHKDNRGKLTAIQYKALSYIMGDKYTLDLMNRTVSLAPTKIETKTEGEPVDYTKLNDKEFNQFKKLTNKIRAGEGDV